MLFVTYWILNTERCTMTSLVQHEYDNRQGGGLFYVVGIWICISRIFQCLFDVKVFFTSMSNKWPVSARTTLLGFASLGHIGRNTTMLRVSFGSSLVSMSQRLHHTFCGQSAHKTAFVGNVRSCLWNLIQPSWLPFLSSSATLTSDFTKREQPTQKDRMLLRARYLIAILLIRLYSRKILWAIILQYLNALILQYLRYERGRLNTVKYKYI